MKKRLFSIAAVALSAVVMFGTFVFTGCSCAAELDDEPLEKKVIADFTGNASARSGMFESDGWENGEPFNVWWKKDNVSYEDSKLSLSVAEMTTKEQVWDEATQSNKDCVSDYYGGEVRTTSYYGYGDFQVRMKPSSIKGTASTFFTCTGPYDEWYNEDGTVARQNEHDEIDIEFLGSDTTHVQFNYFANGVGGHEYLYDLGFDAAEDFHDYGFRWTKDDITWFVDNKPVYKVKRSEIKEGESWPEEPGRVLMNYWCGTEKASAWMGAFEDDYSGKAEYLWASSTATPAKDPASSKPGSDPQPSEPIPTDITWDETTVFPFASTDDYTVETDNDAKKHTVSYDSTSAWANISAEVSKKGRNHVGMTLTGKTDKEINARINVRGGGKNLAKKSYVSEGNTSVVDGALVTVPANGSIDVVVYYEGTIDTIEIMLDSVAQGSADANSLEISNMKLGVKGEVIESEPDKNEGVLIGENLVKFEGGYTIESSEDKSFMTVKYTDVKGDSYTTMNGNVADIVGSNNTFNFKVTNNGAAEAKVRVDIGCTAGSGTNGNNFCNVEATITGATASGNDYQYGGADWFKVAAGETATVSVRFTTGVGANSVIFFVDSSTYDDPSTHSGEVVFKDMSFSVTDVESVPPTPGEGEGVNVLSGVTFTSETYTLTKADDSSSLTAAYTDLSGKSYATINGDISSVVADNNALTFKVTNNGAAEAKIRVDIKCPVGSGTNESDFCNTRAIIAGATASGNDYEYGGADWLKVAAGETATVTVTFTTGVGANGITLFVDSSTYDDETTHTGSVVFTQMSLFTIAA